ncbi:MAG: response regulator [Chloroflexi bacterium]|nr:response regulator [Chloroflexota bacterium]
MKELAFIIEDDKDLSYIFASALEQANYEVEAILDGLAAKKRLEETTPHMVILDMHLPSISGADLLTQIRKDARFTDTSVIIITADARMGEAFTDAADFVLVKPIAFTQLRDLAARLHKA